MIKRFFPWKYFLSRAARRYGVLDPVSFLARLRSFAQPSEVQEPIELLRAGMVFHARGLLNTKAIQHNLDWVWPYWIVRQFNPADPSFIPRAFSFSHINLTHRNWTAVGLPGLALYPIVDPHGLVTPLQDGWSLDCWYYNGNGDAVFPSRLDHVDQYLRDDADRRVVTKWKSTGISVSTTVYVEEAGEEPILRMEAAAETETDGWLVIALRPYNPEGIQFIEQAAGLENDVPGWQVNAEHKVLFSRDPVKVLYSNYHDADVSLRLQETQDKTSCRCRIGMGTAAAFFRVSGREKDDTITVSVPLGESGSPNRSRVQSWPEAERSTAVLRIPDARLKFLYRAAVRTLIHLAAGDIVPGPYTYNRFWFRDACLMLHPMLSVGLHAESRRQLDRFAHRQKSDGFFHSQDGEWDANGQVLWIYNRYRKLTGGDHNPDWLKAVEKGALWITGKRVRLPGQKKYNGLLPPGFSAEHFGPNDYYYWDDFWAAAGLYGAAEMMEHGGYREKAELMRQNAGEMEQCIRDSLEAVMGAKKLRSLPISPNRRMDSGAIGSLVADYPLQLFGPGDERSMATVEFLLENCLQQGCFFQDMIHSGINIYMTLMLAQVLLRAGDSRFWSLVSRAADFASPTGQWPEAIHPITGGGCMGDGQHGWAAAEWVMLIRNLFVLEEKNQLILGRGVQKEWLQSGVTSSFGPTLTPYGKVTVRIRCEDKGIEVDLAADWYDGPRPEIIVDIPGWERQQLREPAYSCRLTRS